MKRTPDLTEQAIRREQRKPDDIGGLFAVVAESATTPTVKECLTVAPPKVVGGSDSLPAGSIYERWGRISKEERRAQVKRWKELLRPVVDDIARRFRGEGFIAADIQTAGALAGVINTSEIFLRQPFACYRNAYAFIGPWLSQLAEKGELSRVPDPRYPGKQLERKTTRGLSKGTPQNVFCANEFAGRPAMENVA